MDIILGEFKDARLVTSLNEGVYMYALVSFPLSETDWSSRIRDQSDIKADYLEDKWEKVKEHPHYALTWNKIFHNEALIKAFNEKQKVKHSHSLYVFTQGDGKLWKRISLDSLLPAERRPYIEFLPQMRLSKGLICVKIRERARTYRALKSYMSRVNGSLSSLLFFDDLFPSYELMKPRREELQKQLFILSEKLKADPSDHKAKRALEQVSADMLCSISEDHVSREQIEEFQEARRDRHGGSSQVDEKQQQLKEDSDPARYSPMYCAEAEYQFDCEKETMEVSSWKATFSGGRFFSE